jgi:hypothetical protein
MQQDDVLELVLDDEIELFHSNVMKLFLYRNIIRVLVFNGLVTTMFKKWPSINFWIISWKERDLIQWIELLMKVRKRNAEIAKHSVVAMFHNIWVPVVIIIKLMWVIVVDFRFIVVKIWNMKNLIKLVNLFLIIVLI